MFSRLFKLAKPLLLVNLLASACTASSDKASIPAPEPEAPKPVQPLDPNQAGTPIDRPQKPSDQVNTDSIGKLIQAIFLSGSQFVNESSSVAAGETFTMPARREQAQTWTDKQGRFWLFGGKTDASYQQDLWQLDPQTQTWKEVSAHDAQVPPARAGALTWVDDEGNLHLAGGESLENDQHLLRADHWVFAVNEQKWNLKTVENSDFLRINAAISTRPGSSGYFYGGYQRSENGSVLYRDDLWTLVEGGKSWRRVPTPKGPSSRSAASLWVDSQGLVWLHAGFGTDNAGNEGHLNDLWVYDLQKNEWNLTAGTPAIENCRVDIPEIQGPVARAGALHWTDAAGQLWLFGGESLLQCGTVTHLNDVWRFNPERKVWSLIEKRSEDPHSRYESSRHGIGSRSFASAWYEAGQNKLWIFGGFGYAGDLLPGSLRDMWTFNQEAAP